jgi:hypothetical protein
MSIPLSRLPLIDGFSNYAKGPPFVTVKFQRPKDAVVYEYHIPAAHFTCSLL